LADFLINYLGIVSGIFFCQGIVYHVGQFLLNVNDAQGKSIFMLAGILFD
jgi:hypothetical protein